MSLISRLMVLLGMLSLFHAYVHPRSPYFHTNHVKYSAYSAHEFSTLPNRSKSHTKPSSLPLDIQIETVIAVFLSCFGLVLGSEPLRPISWNTWAGKIEREGAPNPFQALEDRVGFMDIRAKRREFADWVRSQGELKT
jgi:membrane magnesium transporter 1